ncbi:MAG TPA: translation elongation factor Ts [Gemmatimonadaceae bacterium]|jgi:elongation factor Ts|nr:translation elongation factor Ts [Gemmatimonadaceae bacterium]
MATITAKDVQELRQRTGAGMMDCKKALDETAGDIDKAVENLRKRGVAKAEKRADRTTSEGIIGHYVHHNGRVAVLVELNCETDFVARTEDFRELAKHVAEHVAATAPLAVDRDGIPAEKIESERRIAEEQTRAAGKPEAMLQKIVDGKIEAFFKDVTLLAQPWVREPKQTIGDLVKAVSAKTGENIQVKRFVRYQLGEG